MERDFGALITISANRGEPRMPSPAPRGVPIEVPLIGSVQSTHAAYCSGLSVRPSMTSPATSVTVNPGSAVPPSR